MSPASRVQSVDRAVHLLQAVAETADSGAGTVALADRCGLNRATAWRILSTLESHGLVSCDPSTNRWRIGAGLVEIVQTSGRDSVLRHAHGVLEDLAEETGETAALAVLRDGDLSCVDEVAPASVVAVRWAGRSMSLHSTSTGKALLAWSRNDDVKALLPSRLRRHSDTTITTRAALKEELARTRERGYAICRGEFDASAWGVSAPVLGPSGGLLAVLSIWGPSDRISDENLPALGRSVIRAAQRLSSARDLDRVPEAGRKPARAD